jgi:IS30 family transposase
MASPQIMRKQWSLDEVRQLRNLASQQVPLVIIARKLGRSPSAVESKASRERISLRRKSNTLKTML